MKVLFGPLFTLAVLCVPMSVAWAEYEVILKNGGRITVQSYREEGGMIKFSGLGGEIGIARSEIRDIRKADDTTGVTLDLSRPLSPSPASPAPHFTKDKQPEPIDDQPRGETRFGLDEKAKQEKEYQEKLAEMTHRLREMQQRYAAETRGTTGPEPSFFTTEEAFKGHQQDLLSRLRAANAPLGAPVTEGEKRLTALREQIFQLENQRNALIEEMKRKGFVSAATF